MYAISKPWPNNIKKGINTEHAPGAKMTNKNYSQSIGH